MHSDTLSSEPSDSGSYDPPDKYKTKLHSTRSKAVYVALLANLSIFTVKLVFGILGRSSAMLSEALHSFADSFNSVCLIIGLKRGNRPADEHHHFGYGLEANVWTLFACILMLISACLSLYWGVDRLVVHKDTHDLFSHYNWIAGALAISALFEVWAVNNASRAVIIEMRIPYQNPLQAFIDSLKSINNIKSPTTRFVWYEDTAALAGVLIALISVTSAVYVVPDQIAYIPDGIASVIIGAILFSLAISLFTTYLTNLGAAAKPQVENKIIDLATNINGISEVHDLKTMDMGSSGLIVNMEIEVDPEIQVKDVDDITERLEEKLKTTLQNVSHVNIEVCADETETNWSEKFEAIIQEGIDLEVLNHREAKILNNFYEFTDTTVDEVMVPRTDIDCIEKSDSIDELLDIVISTGHTRIPVYDDNIDDILGVIHSKDIFKILRTNGEYDDVTLETLVRELPIVPENKSISKMLNELITSKMQMALVADEHGGIAGLVTIEDLIEEIFGEIWDEYDVEIIERKRLDANTIIVSAKINIEEINDRYDLDLPTEEFTTIGGFVFGQLGRAPEVKDIVNAGDFTFEVESVDGHKIETIKLKNPNGLIDHIELDEQKRKTVENSKD